MEDLKGCSRDESPWAGRAGKLDRPIRAYLAAPLFSDAERSFNLKVRDHLQGVARVFLPQVDGGLLVEFVSTGMPEAEARRRVFLADVEAIRHCDCLVAVLDGRSIDEGVAFEIGVAWAVGRRCVGLQTDPRRLMPIGNNPMIDCALEAVFTTIEGLVDWLGSVVSK
jgi:nucleoside 2-deoxyribosyltransferase